MRKPTIHVLCPDDNTPTGGIKTLYRHVDVLNRNGIEAHILHEQERFRCTWFSNDTKVAYIPDIQIESTDFVVLPEIYEEFYLHDRSWNKKRKTPSIKSVIESKAKKIIYNLSGYYTFVGHSLDMNDYRTMYALNGIEAVLVGSQDSKQYIKYTFPHLRTCIIRKTIDPKIFSCNSNKKKQIAFMTQKNFQDVVQILNILKFRNAMSDFEIRPIDNMTQEQVAQILGESLIFLSFGYPEGWPRPPAEAMASGCVVIGYHGMGGREYFKEDLCFPIEINDIIGFAKAVEKVINMYNKNPNSLIETGARASKYIRETYSSEREKKDILDFWGSIIDG